MVNSTPNGLCIFIYKMVNQNRPILFILTDEFQNVLYIVLSIILLYHLNIFLFFFIFLYFNSKIFFQL
jgi:hypothetical protein